MDRSTFAFHDVDTASGAVEGAELLPISGEYIAPEQSQNRDELIATNIERWAKEQGEEISKFYFMPAVRLRGAVETAADLSVLAAMIQALDKRQLASVSLPLDVVAALLGKR